MAIYHNTFEIITRGKGRSAVAASAYQSGTRMVNEWDGVVHDYSRKKGVVYSEIMLPDNAPNSFSDRNVLWNSLELFEKRSDAQLARRFEMSLPRELGFEENLSIIHDYCEQFRSDGMVVDFSMHDPDPPNHNPHVHILLTMRPIDENGNWAPKSRLVYDLDENGERIRLPSGKWKSHKEDLMNWNQRANADIWRESWANIVNAHLEANGFSERIDHRGYFGENRKNCKE